MDLFNILQKLQAIGQVSEATDKCPECGEVHEGSCSKSKMKEEQVEEAKKPDADGDGVPDWADKKPGEDDNEEKIEEGFGDLVKKGVDVAKKVGSKALDTLGHGSDEELLKDLQKKSGVPSHAQHGKKNMAQANESSGELDILRRLAGLQECGEMEVDPMAQVSPISAVSDMATPVQVIQSPDAAQAMGQEEMPAEMPAQAEEKPRYTLTVQNGDSNLSMTTDIPDEIIHVMKLAGVKGEVKAEKQVPGQEQGDEQGEKEVDEAWGNTPATTKEKEPRGYGDIRDWGMKGTGGGKAGSAANKPYGSGDNPLSEDAIISDYQLFKSSK